MTQNRREIIELEIASLRKTIDKINVDHMIVTGMIDDLINDRIGMTREIIDLTKMLKERSGELEEMGK